MKLRPVLAVVAASSLLVGTGIATAAPKPKPKPKPVKPVCNLVVDEAGDALDSAFATGVYPANEAGADILSADVATDAKTLTTVIRVAKLTALSPTSPTGLHWKYFVDVDGVQIYTQAVAEATGTTFRYGQIDATTGTSASLGEATGVLDTAKNEVRVSVPLSALPVSLKPGKRITGSLPNSGRFIGSSSAASLSEPTDSAEGFTPYTTGAPSCVAVGK